MIPLTSKSVGISRHEATAIVIDQAISGQVIEGWVVSVNNAYHPELYGTFEDKDSAIKFASNFQFAIVRPVYWPSTNRG